MTSGYQQKEVGIEELFLSPLRQNRATPPVSLELISVTRNLGPQVPVMVRRSGDRRYEILANAETWIAVQRAGLYRVPITIKENVDDEEARFLVNVGTEENPIAEAKHFSDYLNKMTLSGKKRSVTKVSQVFGKGRSYVSHALRLLTLPVSIQAGLESGQISLGHAKAILSAHSAEHQLSVFHTIILKKLSVRQTEEWVRGGKTDRADTLVPAQLEHKDPDTARLETTLSELVGSHVSISSERGVLEIDYGGNYDVLDGVLKRLGYKYE